MIPLALRLLFSSGDIAAFAVSFLWPLCPCTGLEHLPGGVWPPSHQNGTVQEQDGAIYIITFSSSHLKKYKETGIII